MFKAAWRSAGRTAFFLVPIAGVSALVSPARAQSSPTVALPDIVVTADRVQEAIGQVGSAVTVIPGSEIEKFGGRGLADVLRNVAGVEVDEAGGVGSATEVRIRGSNPGQVLILLDGVRIGNTASTDGSLDFGNLSIVDVDRIEVLRGPQSALYGSDAMGGVINIITKKGSKTPKRSVTVEAGSYGTLSTRASMSGADDAWTYSLGVNLLHSDGFPRYGYRINQPLYIGNGDLLPPLPADDPTNKGGANGRFSYKVSDSVSVDFGFTLFGNDIRFDNPYAVNYDSDVFNHFNTSTAMIGNVFVRANVDPVGSALRNQVTLYSNATSNNIWEAEGCYDQFAQTTTSLIPNPNSPFFNCRSSYFGMRYGAEYQGDLDLGPYGGLTFGARSETETASTSQSPNPDDAFTPVDARQVTNSVYALHHIDLFRRLDLTLGGRIDAIEGGQTFATWRATAAYHIDETGTKLRASVGTGAKAPTLYQRYSLSGDPNLLPEQNFGVDAGIDQKLFNDRVTASVTAFDAKYRNLIYFADVSSCTAEQVAVNGGCYYNIGRAETSGVEFSTDAVILPDTLRLRASYTYLNGQNLTANMQLLHEPYNTATISLIYDGIPNFELEPRLSLVGDSLDENFLTGAYVTLAAYAKLDVLASYKFNENFSVFGRAENLNDARYQEVYGYGTAGRSFYAGLTYSW